MLELDQQSQIVNGMRLATFRRCYQQILNGDDPWLPLGNVKHQWFGCYQGFRKELVREAIDVPSVSYP